MEKWRNQRYIRSESAFKAASAVVGIKIKLQSGNLYRKPGEKFLWNLYNQYDEYCNIVYFFENYFLFCIKTPPFNLLGFFS